MIIQGILNGVPVRVVNIETIGSDTYVSYVPLNLNVSATEIKVEKRSMGFGTSALVLLTSATVIS